MFAADPCTGAMVACSPLTSFVCWASCEVGTAAAGAAETAGDVASAAKNADVLIDMIMSLFTDPLGAPIKNILILMFSWLLIPTSRFFDTSETSVTATIMDSWVFPIVVVLLVCGTLWQGFRMVISRRSEPLIRVAKALMTTAAAGGIATIGAAALLNAGDRFSCWVLGEALRGPNSDSPNQLIENGNCASDEIVQAVLESSVIDRLVDILKLPAVMSAATGVGLILGLLIALFIGIAALCQLFLLVIRGGSLVILVGLVQLAAAGQITRTTSPWIMRAISWVLALALYKPAAAMVYATALLLIDNAGSDDGPTQVSNFIMGMTMLVLALFAMPALMRFFTWGFSALGRDGSLAGAATGLDNLGDDAIRVGNDLRSNAGRQASSINSSLPQPVATVETVAGAGGASRAVGFGAAGPGGGTGAVGAGSGAVAGVATRTTIYSSASSGAAAGGAAAAGAAAAPATAGTSLIVAGSLIGLSAATTQIGASLKRTVTNHMDEDNE